MRKAIIEETPEENWSEPYATTELAHGRLEKRTIRVASISVNELDFLGARSIAIIDRFVEVKKTGKRSHERVALISSMINPQPDLLLWINRAHWTIESSLFHVRDTTFKEDQCTMHTLNGPWNMALLRSVAIGAAHLVGFKSIPDAIANFRKNATTWLKSFKVHNRLAQI